MLEMLVEGLEVFGNSDVSKGTVARVRHRLEIFPSLELFEKRGEEASTASAKSSEYPDVPIKRVADFFPIGEDPRSGLWEFVHLGTGGEPGRGKDGRLILTEETGLVLVLLPGGKFHMGAQRVVRGRLRLRFLLKARSDEKGPRLYIGLRVPRAPRRRLGRQRRGLSLGVPPQGPPSGRYDGVGFRPSRPSP